MNVTTGNGGQQQMSKEDHPVFFGKDKSNLPKDDPQPTLFNILDEAEEMLARIRAKQEQARFDLEFALIALRFNND